jgi:hypothetical protein
MKKLQGENSPASGTGRYGLKKSGNHSVQHPRESLPITVLFFFWHQMAFKSNKIIKSAE